METINNYSLPIPSFWKRFLDFSQFITGSVLRIIYLIGVVVISLTTLIGGIMYLGSFFVALTNFSLSGILVALFLFTVNLIGGTLLILVLRVYCEFIMVIFKINENLQAIRDRNETI